jgi:hypothetical protein
MAFATLFGAQIPTNLLMWKICHLQLNYTSDICSNLSAGNEHIYGGRCYKLCVVFFFFFFSGLPRERNG